jgi:UDP-N-acetyl-D-mannosaminuronic acid transferase (WecB/TagA/CpsF family)
LFEKVKAMTFELVLITIDGVGVVIGSKLCADSDQQQRAKKRLSVQAILQYGK